MRFMMRGRPDHIPVQLVLGLQGGSMRRRRSRRAGAGRAPYDLRSGVPARRLEPAGADHRAGSAGALAQHRPVVAGCGEREQRLAGILAQDRGERFDVAAPPLFGLR